MKVAIIGYGQAGRSTFYRAAARGLAKGDVTAVPVPDARFDAIVAQVKPKKQTPATVILHDDVEAASGSGKTLSLKLIDQAKKADLLLHVVRAFDNPISPYFAEVDPLRDQENIDVELVLADLQIVENRLEKLQKSPTVKQSGSSDYLEKQFFDRVKPLLEEGTPMRAIEMNDDEQIVARHAERAVELLPAGSGHQADEPRVELHAPELGATSQSKRGHELGAARDVHAEH